MIRRIGRHEVRVQGRTAEDGGRLWMFHSLCEAGFRVTGARFLELELEADDTVLYALGERLRPRFCVRVDGDKVVDRRMSKKEETVVVFDAQRPWDAEVRLIKLSECTQSVMALKEIRTDGQVEPLEDRGMKIEFIGDSITCGYGVEGKNGLEDFTTATENAEKSYAGLVSEALGADRMLTSFSGHGIVSGYTDDPEKRNLSELVPPYYDRMGRNFFRLPSGRTAEEILWDFSAWQPEKILINLGTNDLSWCGEREPRKDMYRKQYKEFLRTVRKNNPEAKLLCVLGIMGTGLNEKMVQAVNEYRAETGDRNIHTLALEEQNGERDGFGSNFHPNEKTQRLLADRILYFILNA